MIRRFPAALFWSHFGTTNHRKNLLDLLGNFLERLEESFSNYRVLVHGSFISAKQSPADVDVIASVISFKSDPGFNKYVRLQPLANPRVDVFTLDLKYSFDVVQPVPDAQSMVDKFNTLSAHLSKGIQCTSAVEIT